MDISNVSTNLAGVIGSRRRADPVASVPVDRFDQKELPSAPDADALSVHVPAGLTFSPFGLSKQSTSRFIADI